MPFNLIFSIINFSGLALCLVFFALFLKLYLDPKIPKGTALYYFLTGVMLFALAFALALLQPSYANNGYDPAYHLLIVIGLIFVIVSSRHQINLLGMFQRASQQLKEQTAALTRQTAQDSTILDSVGECLFAINEQGKIIRFNGQAEKLLGWKTAEVLGKDLVDIVPGYYDENGRMVPKNKRPPFIALRTGKIVRINWFTSRYSLMRKDGTRFPVSGSVTPIILNGRIVGAIGIMRDATEEKDLDKIKTEFVSLASHQLQTPLTTINWYADMLLAGDAGALNAKQTEFVEELHQGAHRMSQLVRSLLDVSRIEMRSLNINPEPTDIALVCRDLRHEMEPIISGKRLSFKLEQETGLPKLNIDPHMVRTAIQNIMSNAVKYTPEGGKIKLSLKKRPRGINLDISDTGYGIPREQQAKVFTKLFRGENILNKETEGTGLGLYIAKAIIDKSGGKIWFESEENAGTTFHVSLPVTHIKAQKGTTELSRRRGILD